MSTLIVLLQVSVALVAGRLGWQLLRVLLVDRPDGPPAPQASRLAHGLFAASLLTPATLALLAIVPRPSALPVLGEAATTTAPESVGSASAFTLLGGLTDASLTPEAWRIVLLTAAAVLLPFSLVAAVRFIRQWTTLRAIASRAVLLRRIGRVEILRSDEIGTPFSTIALGRVQVFVPEGLLHRRADLQLVLRHELHHHRRRDVHWALFVELLRVAFAWNPAMHSWARELSDWQERACDAELIARGTQLRAYAGCLLRVAEDNLHSPIPVASAAMARPSGRSVLKRRIEMLLDSPRRHGRLGARGSALLIALALLLPTAAWAASAALPARTEVALTAKPEPAVSAETLVEFSAPQRSSLRIGSTAPEVILDDGPGGDSRLTDLRGQVVVLHFWADWCRFCNDAIPALKALEDELGNEVAIAGISVDETEQAFDRFVAKHEIDWPQHRSEKGWKGETAQAYGVRALPMHVVIDQEGRVAGSGVQLAQLRPTIDALLAAGAR